MIDLETMGMCPNAAIIAIGAVEFDQHLKMMGAKFYQTIDLQSAVNLGGTIDPSTVIWWMQQNDTARAEFKRPGGLMISVLSNFNIFLDSCCDKDSRLLWGNGSDFDNVILASAYRSCNLEVPWKFWNNRCYRTVKALRPDIKIHRSGTYHNALDDAVSQAEHLMRMI